MEEEDQFSHDRDIKNKGTPFFTCNPEPLRKRKMLSCPLACEKALLAVTPSNPKSDPLLTAILSSSFERRPVFPALFPSTGHSLIVSSREVNRSHPLSLLSSLGPNPGTGRSNWTDEAKTDSIEE